MEFATCSFFGHRKIDNSDNIEQILTNYVEDLIVNHQVQNFLFGSNSEFNELSYVVVTQLKERYPSIKRIRYTCKSENCILEFEREKKEKIFSRVLKEEIHLFGFEEEFEHKTKYCAGKASYIERNQAMIDDSDFCLFYYNDNYIPPTKTNSGTCLAYKYAVRKKKIVFNLFSKLSNKKR